MVLPLLLSQSHGSAHQPDHAGRCGLVRPSERPQWHPSSGRIRNEVLTRTRKCHLHHRKRLDDNRGGSLRTPDPRKLLSLVTEILATEAADVTEAQRERQAPSLPHTQKGKDGSQLPNLPPESTRTADGCAKPTSATEGPPGGQPAPIPPGPGPVLPGLTCEFTLPFTDTRGSDDTHVSLPPSLMCEDRTITAAGRVCIRRSRAPAATAAPPGHYKQQTLPPRGRGPRCHQTPSSNRPQRSGCSVMAGKVRASKRLPPHRPPAAEKRRQDGRAAQHMHSEGGGHTRADPSSRPLLGV